MTDRRCLIVLVLIVLVGLALRWGQWQLRPLHGDEAIHAVKLSEWMQQGVYRYDPQDYHGPTLNLFTFLPAWLGGADSLVSLNEAMLLVVPVFFGVGLIALHGLLLRQLGAVVLLSVALLLACSPAFVFYSRYYIQEMLLVCFTAGLICCGWRYVRRPGMAWALAAGAFAGLMHASKETCVIAYFCLGVATLVVLFSRSGNFTVVRESWKPLHLVATIGAGVLVSTLLFTSFGFNPRGVVDSILTYLSYLVRADGAGLHDHPWHFYLEILTLYHDAPGPIFSEWIILFLAVVGLCFGHTQTRISQSFRLFVSVYTVLMLSIYSAIPYKTPWCLLGFHHGLVLLAGIGLSVIVSQRQVVVRYGGLALAVLGVIHLFWLALLVRGPYCADPRSPYVYAHPLPEVHELVDHVQSFAAAQSEEQVFRVDVFCSGNDYWPLPWYFRNLTAVGYYDQVPSDYQPAPLILTLPEHIPQLQQAMYQNRPPGRRDLYVDLFDQLLRLRLGRPIRALTTLEKLQRYKLQSDPPDLPHPPHLPAEARSRD